MDAINPKSTKNNIPTIRRAIEKLSLTWRLANPDVDVRMRVATKYALDIARTGYEGRIDPRVRIKIQELCQTTFARAFLQDPTSVDGKFFKQQVKRALEWQGNEERDEAQRQVKEHLTERDVNDFMLAFREIYRRLNKPREN
jgi:hypothetical protein